VTLNLANTPENIYWNQRQLRESIAKAAGVRSSSVFYMDVLPNMMDANTFTKVGYLSVSAGMFVEGAAVQKGGGGERSC